MNYSNFNCPVCHTKLKMQKSQLSCQACPRKYRIKTGIPRLIVRENISTILIESQIQYEKMHQKWWGKLGDGSYEVLASFARGNKTVDIACGEGYIEQLAPHTVGVEFSWNALKKAQKNGARNLVQATAESLPFSDDAFDVAICAGSMEHFADPQKALLEIARVSKIQILTVHRPFPVLFGSLLIPITRFVFGIFHQPIEKPFTMGELEKMYKKAGLTVIFKGVWTLPVNYGRVIPFLPIFTNIPSCYFIISHTKKAL